MLLLTRFLVALVVWTFRGFMGHVALSFSISIIFKSKIDQILMSSSLRPLLTMDLATAPDSIPELKKLLKSFQEALRRLYTEHSCCETKQREITSMLDISNRSLQKAETEIKSMRDEIAKMSMAQEAIEESEMNATKFMLEQGVPMGVMVSSPTSTPNSHGPAVGLSVAAFGSLSDNSAFSRPPMPMPDTANAGAPASAIIGSLTKMGSLVGSLSGRSSFSGGVPMPQSNAVQQNPFAPPGSLTSRPAFGSMVPTSNSSMTSPTTEGFVSGSLTLKSRQSTMPSNMQTAAQAMRPMHAVDSRNADVEGSEDSDTPRVRIKHSRDD